MYCLATRMFGFLPFIRFYNFSSLPVMATPPLDREIDATSFAVDLALPFSVLIKLAIRFVRGDVIDPGRCLLIGLFYSYESGLKK